MEGEDVGTDYSYFQFRNSQRQSKVGYQDGTYSRAWRNFITENTFPVVKQTNRV